MRRPWLGMVLGFVVGCAPVVEEAVLAEPEPIVRTDLERAPSVLECEAVGDDGIGGTGCPAIE